MSKFEEGLKIRKEVLGEEQVEKAFSTMTSFNEDMQKLVTEYCWGEVWTREGLDRKQRSLINLGILTALNRAHEFKLHVNGAIRNGCTEEEIKEVIMQTAIYCGVPAAMESFRNAMEVLDEHKKKQREQN
ncbi:carboxymuconolactone decarboxylase family protein [Planomicrobium sp. CPCC 101079]|uniref:carboxymuconolactone decarboxylase family protein n=1 Tax=Planomicrobium sp. CPCC 101079 TaxID=2599618 RepID=UPI0011B5534F|nr:carboxymuconolactone decarboxylase family protein [Planomicrobium sp. CPCC 101079]TWT01871.1 4-carboxymuconolactone decarboxylase [Planomicrobium sp. CPCC 101079]